MRSRGRRILLGIVVLLVLAYVVLLRWSPGTDDCAFPLDIGALRAAATSTTGALPTELRYEPVLSFHAPEAMVVTGAGFGLTELRVYAWQLVYPDRTIIIDTAMTAAQAAEMSGEDYDAAAWTRVEAGMRAASDIYVTHEHGDHLGGLLSVLSSTAVQARARLTVEQLAHPDRLEPLSIPSAHQAGLRPLSYASQHVAAPGLVLIKAPGHTPGSQLVFVHLKDGEEALLLGDTAWHVENVEQAVGPPRLVSAMLHNDREANVCQLAAIRAAGASEPQLAIIPGHDRGRVDSVEKRGAIIRGFR